MRGLRASAILIGVAVDKLAAVVSIGLLLSILGADSASFQFAALGAGALCTGLGAFVAARRARQRPLAHGAAVGIVALLISVSRFVLTPVLAEPDSTAAHSLPWELTAWLTVVAAGFAGGAVAGRGRERHGGALLVVAVACLPAMHAATAAPRTTGAEEATRAACDLAESLAGPDFRPSLRRSSGLFEHEAFAGPVPGCRLVITGSFEDTPPGEDAASRLHRGFGERGWRELLAHSADGKDGTAFAFRKAEVTCFVRGSWDGGSDGEPSVPRGSGYSVSVLCTRPGPAE